MKKKVTILGVTGSIGRQTIEVINANKDKFEIVGIASKRNAELLKFFAEKFKVPYVALYDRKDLSFSYNPKLLYGREGLEELASLDTDLVVISISGIEAIYPTKVAIENGKKIAIATKEVIVACGELIKTWLRKSKSILIPIDSEHSALFQLMNAFKRKSIDKIFLTASGGPFWNKPKEYIENATLEDVLKHPTWNMGSKTTIDSANLVNKALEVIEAHFFFNFKYESIKVLIHPQSLVHGMIELRDGSIIAHMAYPDMKIPIQYALFYPERSNFKWNLLNLSDKKLEFYEVDLERYPALALAYEVGKKGGVYPAIFAIADEIVVGLFLNNLIKFKEIVPLIQYTMEAWNGFSKIEDLSQLDIIINWVKDIINKKLRGKAI